MELFLKRMADLRESCDETAKLLLPEPSPWQDGFAAGMRMAADWLKHEIDLELEYLEMLRSKGLERTVTAAEPMASWPA